MTEKRPMDTAGAMALTLFALVLAFNQVVIKVTGTGFGPVFQAGLRSIGALLVIYLWMVARKIPFALPEGARKWGIVLGLLFTTEFIALFNALDLTSVSRASIIFYSMPVWLALISHFALPGEHLTRTRAVGLVLAMVGVIVAVSDRGSAEASWLGDILALIAALTWGGIALTVRLTPMANARPEQQLFWQLWVSAILLTLSAPLFGPLLRDPGVLHLWGLVFQIFAVASFGFLMWFFLIRTYHASAVASFSFLSPVFAVFMGWALLDEDLGSEKLLALALVSLGVFLINRK